MKDLADQNGRFNGVIRILLWSPTRSCFCRSPFIYRRLSKPDRDVAAPTQCGVVLRPVGHFIFGFCKFVTTALAMFVGHWMFWEGESAGIMPVRGNHGGFLIYSTTPSRTQIKFCMHVSPQIGRAIGTTPRSMIASSLVICQSCRNPQPVDGVRHRALM